MTSHILEGKRKYYSKKRFGGNYDKVLERDNFTCQICNSKKNVVVHRKDGNVENNNLDNLIVVCKKCHQKLHYEIGSYDYDLELLKRRQDEIKKLRKGGMTVKEIGIKYNISSSRVYFISSKKYKVYK